MGSRLDDELDQILKNTSFESGNELDQTKNSSKFHNYIPKVTFKYLIPIICLLMSFFILQAFIPTNIINKILFWGILIIFVMVFSAYLLNSKNSEYQPKWRGKPVQNLHKRGIINKLRNFFKA